MEQCYTIGYMKLKLVHRVVSVVLFAFFIPLTSYAVSPQATSTPTIAELVQQIQALQSQIAQLTAELTATKNDVAVIKEELRLTKTLKFGMTDGEVKKLQEFLSTMPDIYPEGLVTGYFGALTEKAVKKWQEKNEIESIGVVGPKTRAKLSEVTASNSSGGGSSSNSANSIASDNGNGNSGNNTVGNNGSSNAVGNTSSSTSPGFENRVENHPTTTPSGTVPATPAQPIGQTGVTTVPAISATPTQPAADTTPPTISNVQSTNITQTTATISWTTNEISSSDIYYSKNSSVLTSGTSRVTIAGNVTSHGITLASLSASSTYYYLVVAKDEAGNTATSSVNNFQTIAEPVVTATTKVITATAGTGGTISPAGSVVVTQGTNKTFTITANAGYTIATVVVDGVYQGAISTYTFTNVQTTHTISTTFTPITYAITVSQGANGTITPGSTEVNSGSSQTFTITPANGYQITSVALDGYNQGAVSTYTLTNVTAIHTINATFALIPISCALTVSIAETSPAAQNINPGQSAVSLVKFNATSNCDGTLNSFAVSLLPMPSGYQNISTLRLYNDVSGVQLGTTQTVTGASVNFASVNTPLTANQALVLKVVGDVSPSAANGGTVYGVFGGSSAVNSSGGTIGNNASGNIFAGNTMTIQTPAPVCVEPYSFVKTLATLGSGDGQVNEPRGIAVDAQGNVYVADTSNHRIQKFDSNGNFVTKWGATRGSGDGQFSAPVDVAVDTQGNVYVADNYNYRIQKFTSGGTFLAKWGTQGSGDGQFNSANGIGLDSGGNVYVADYGNNRIQKFDSNGTFLSKFGTQGSGDGQFNGPNDVAVDAQGNSYVADYTSNNRIQKFDSNGNFLLQWGQVSAPSGIALDSAGNVFVAEMNNNYRISKFDSTGVSIAHWNNSGGSGGQLSGPWRVAVDTQGNVYVAEIFPAHRIVKFAPCPSLAMINTPGSASHLAVFSRNLTIGSVGIDVKRLQALLVSEVNYSTDLVTGYFGRITRDAVRKLQTKYKIEPTSGYFGEITRKALTAAVLNR